jgi:cytochrome P450
MDRTGTGTTVLTLYFSLIEAKFFSSIGFGGGPRICIGRNMALEEMQLFLALLCRDFQIELSEKIQIEPKFQFTMSLSPRLPIRLTPV